jgi:hypothetical protein
MKAANNAEVANGCRPLAHDELIDLLSNKFLWHGFPVNLALLWQILVIDWRNWIPESDFQ